MNLSTCTISFRHELVSLSEIARWASSCHFQGIELWGAHAIHLEHSLDWAQQQIQDQNLKCSMISDYFGLEAPAENVFTRAEQIFKTAQSLGSTKVRTFAGTRPSSETSELQWQQAKVRLKELSKMAADHGCRLLVETHPNTLADSYESTGRLLEIVDHPAFGLNFDVLHVWESGMNPVEALRSWQNHVHHMHLKNIRSRENLTDFLPDNVYSASGRRDGMVPLFQGAFEYKVFFDAVSEIIEPMDASLEWFGPNVRQTLASDSRQLRQRLAVLPKI